MTGMQIVWIACKMTDYGTRLTPWYIIRADQTISRVQISGTADWREFWSNEVFVTLEEAREATGVHKVLCFTKSACEHIDLVNQIHKDEGLICPHCGPGTVLLEITQESDSRPYSEGYTHYCWPWQNAGAPPRLLQKNQVTFNIKCSGGKYISPNGCGQYIKLLDVRREIAGCDCGSPHVGHVPNGSYCWKKLDKNRKYL